MIQQLIVFISVFLFLANNTTAQSWKSFYKKVTPVDNNTFLVNRFDKHGVVDSSGQLIILIKYDTLISYPKGFLAKESLRWSLLSKTGNILYKTPIGAKLPSFDSPAWEHAEHKIPIVKLVVGVADTSDYHTTIPYEYSNIRAMGSNNLFFLVGDDRKKWAVLDTFNQLKTDYIYTAELTLEIKGKFIVEPVDKKTIPAHFYTNWVTRNDTLVCLSPLTGKELWQSATPRHVVCCDKGIHLVKPNENHYSFPREYLIIDEATQSVTPLDKTIQKVHTYLGNGLFYVSWEDGKNGTIDMNGILRKEYSYTEVRKIPRSGVVEPLTSANIDFGDYVYAMNKEGIFLWSPTTNHRMRIDDRRYSLEHYALRPLSKSNRYWVLAESENFEQLEKEWQVSHFLFSKLIICDSISGEVVYPQNYYQRRGKIALEESSPSNNTWVTTNENSYDNGGILFYNGKVMEYENTYCNKLSSDGRFYKMSSFDYNQSYTNDAKIFDTQKGAFVKSDISNAVFFGNKGNEKFVIQKTSSDGNKKEFYLADLELNKIKSLKENLYDFRKIELVDNPENSLLEISKRATNDDGILCGIIDSEGNQILAIEYGDIQRAYQKDGKYAFVTSPLYHLENEYGGFFISNEGKKINCNSRSYSWLDEYILMDIDSLHSCVFNLESGQISQKFKQNSIRLLKYEGSIYIIEQIEGGEIVYNASTFKPISPEPYKIPNSMNPNVLIDYKTGKKLTDWHLFSFNMAAFRIVYKYVEQTIDWGGKCVDGCD